MHVIFSEIGHSSKKCYDHFSILIRGKGQPFLFDFMKGSRWARIHIKWVGSTRRLGLGFWDKKDFERCILLERTRGPAVEHSPGTLGNIMGVERSFISSLPFLLVH